MRRFRTWGASDVDLSRAMTGDATIANPTYAATLAVTIDAPPHDVWPWLAQMGAGSTFSSLVGRHPMAHAS